MDLTHARDRRRRGVGALARVAPVGGLDVHDDVAARQRPLDRLLDRVGDRVRPRRPGEVGETPITTSANCRPGRLPHPQPAELDARAERCDRHAGGLLGIGGSAVHQDVDVPAHQPCRRDQDEHGDEERGERVAVRMTCPHEQQPDEDRDRPGQVAREVERVRGERGAAGAPATSGATSRCGSRRRRSRRRSWRTRTRRSARSRAVSRRAARGPGRRSGRSQPRGMPPRRARRDAPPCRARTGARRRRAAPRHRERGT